MIVGVFVAAGYLVGLLVLGWGLSDLQQFHRPRWVGYGSRDHWRKTMIVAYLFAGWPVLAVVLSWRTGQTRRALIDQRELLRGRP